MIHAEGVPCTECLRLERSMPAVTLVGTDGNAFAIMGRWQMAARRAGWGGGQIQPVLDEASRGDYDHLLQTIMRHSSMPDDDHGGGE